MSINISLQNINSFQVKFLSSFIIQSASSNLLHKKIAVDKQMSHISNTIISTNNHLKSALTDFHALKASNQIPPQMLLKLQYLIIKIVPSSANKASSPEFEQLPQYQKLSLDQISKETGIQLFINIINCLSGKDIVLYVRDEKMYIRKDEALTMWSLCYGTIDNNKFMIYKKPLKDEDSSNMNKINKHKPAYQLQLNALKISKNFKQYKRKSVFGINYKNKQSYLVGFDQQSACDRMHELLRNLIKQKIRNNINNRLSNVDKSLKSSQTGTNKNRKYSSKHQQVDKQQEYYTNQIKYRESLDYDQNKDNESNLSNKPINNSAKRRNTYHQQQSFKKKKNNSIDINLKQQQQEQLQYQQQRLDSPPNNINSNAHNAKQTVLEYIKKQQLLCDQSFKLIKNNLSIRELVHKNQPNIIKQFITINNVNVSNMVELIMEAYLLQNQWNQEIQNISISKKLADNIYQIDIRLKKYSYLSWARGCRLYCVGLKKGEIGYLVLREVSGSEIDSDVVQMSWNQIIQLRQNQQTNKVYMVVLSEFDFKGYSSAEDSQKMGLKVMSSIDKFPNFVETQIMLKKQKNMFKLPNNIEIQAQNNNRQKKIKSKRNQAYNKGKSDRKDLQDNLSEYSLNEQNLKQSNQLPMNISYKPPRLQKNNIQQLQFQKDQSASFDKPNNTISTNPSSLQSYQNYAKILYKTRFKPTQALLEQLRTSNMQNKYYLKHYFDQTPKLDLTKCLQEVETIDNYINQGGIYTIRDNGDVVFYDQKVLQIHKDILKMILKQLGSNLMSGKSIMNMSLPVEIFDDKAILERVAVGYGYAPRFLSEAGQLEDIVKQAQLVILTIMGILPLHLNINKPFNPILGQTFQCLIGGIPFYLQQISHHPPISAVYMKGDNFIFHGSFHSHAQMGLNQVHGKNLTPIFIQFPKTNTSYQIKLNDMEIVGIMYGDKIYRGAGKTFIYEKTNNIFIQCCYGKQKKKVYQLPKGQKMTPNTVVGGIYSVTQNFGNKFMKCENKSKFGGLKPDDIVSKHTEIKGHWGLDIFFNGEKVKSLKDPIPNNIQHPQYALPSDSNFRLDLLYKRLNNMKMANQEKQILQNIQRKDKKLRQGKLP